LPSYDVYAYFGSDSDNRKGTVGIAGSRTYSYSTYSSSGLTFPASYKVTSDTGANYPSANYAVWSNLTSASFAMVFTLPSGGANNGIYGMQIIRHGATNQRPLTVTINSPANGSMFSAGTNITINATASDTTGTVTKVEFYQGSTKLGEDTTAPFSYTWNNIAEGSYDLKAIATDNRSLVATSGVVSISVRSAGNMRNVGLNFGSHSMSSSESAGALVSFANWNNLSSANGSSSSLLTSTGGVSGLTVVWDGFESIYGARSSATDGDEDMMWTYCDNTAGSATVTVSNITSPFYDVYVYFGSDTDGRTGTVGINGSSTYSYSTYSSSSHSFPTSYTVTADTGAGYPPANYAAWQNLTSSSFSVILTKVGANNGMFGMQIVMYGSASASTNKTPHGVPYTWLSASGITSNQDQVENDDPDGDGMATWKEYYAGTDPNIKGSAFKVLSMSTNRSITWYGTSNSGVTNGFRVYRSTNLYSGAWQLVASNLIRAANGTNAWTDPAPPSSPGIYYRPVAPTSVP
jgi:hypothetical protein